MTGGGAGEGAGDGAGKSTKLTGGGAGEGAGEGGGKSTERTGGGAGEGVVEGNGPGLLSPSHRANGAFGFCKVRTVSPETARTISMIAIRGE